MVTIIESNIGALLEFTHPSGWETATDIDLVSLDQRRIGLCASETFDFTSNLDIAGAVTDSTRYRELKNVDDLAYNFQTSTGTQFTFTVNTGGIRQQEAFLRVGQIWVFGNSSGTSNFSRLCQVTRGDCVFYQMAFEITFKSNNSNTEAVTIWQLAVNHLIENSVVIGNNAAHGVGRPFVYGGTPASGTRRMRNCLAWKCRNTANGRPDVVVENCASIRPTAISGWSTGWNAASTNNAGSATQAPGSSPQDNVVADNEFVDGANQDFHLLSTGVLAENGVDLSASFTLDYENTVRSVPWDIGPFDFLPGGGVLSNTARWGSAAILAARLYQQHQQDFYKEIR